jgi:hypothetical protein
MAAKSNLKFAQVPWTGQDELLKAIAAWSDSPISSRSLFVLRKSEDRARALSVLAERGLRLQDGTLGYACGNPSEDWMMLDPSGLYVLDLGTDETQILAPEQWAKVVVSLHVLQGTPELNKQFRRMSTSSREQTDTAFVVEIVGRYQAARSGVEFEPNGLGCSNLRVANTGD